MARQRTNIDLRSILRLERNNAGKLGTKRIVRIREPTDLVGFLVLAFPPDLIEGGACSDLHVSLSPSWTFVAHELDHVVETTLHDRVRGVLALHGQDEGAHAVAAMIEFGHVDGFKSELPHELSGDALRQWCDENIQTVEFDSMFEAAEFCVEFPGAVWDLWPDCDPSENYRNGHSTTVTLHIEDHEAGVFDIASMLKAQRDKHLRELRDRR